MFFVRNNVDALPQIVHVAAVEHSEHRLVVVNKENRSVVFEIVSFDIKFLELTVVENEGNFVIPGVIIHMLKCRTQRIAARQSLINCVHETKTELLP